MRMTNEEINAISNILSPPIAITASELGKVIKFLGSLEYYPNEHLDLIVPESVPSGLPVIQEKEYIN